MRGQQGHRQARPGILRALTGKQIEIDPGVGGVIHSNALPCDDVVTARLNDLSGGRRLQLDRRRLAVAYVDYTGLRREALSTGGPAELDCVVAGMNPQILPVQNPTLISAVPTGIGCPPFNSEMFTCPVGSSARPADGPGVSPDVHLARPGAR